MNISIPKNVFSAFAMLFFISAAIVPLQNLVVWGPDWVLGFYISPEITAEKISIGVIGLAFFFLYLAYKKKDSITNYR